jgi:hypothetical protein
MMLRLERQWRNALLVSIKGFGQGLELEKFCRSFYSEFDVGTATTLFTT